MDEHRPARGADGELNRHLGAMSSQTEAALSAAHAVQIAALVELRSALAQPEHRSVAGWKVSLPLTGSGLSCWMRRPPCPSTRMVNGPGLSLTVSSPHFTLRGASSVRSLAAGWPKTSFTRAPSTGTAAGCPSINRLDGDAHGLRRDRGQAHLHRLTGDLQWFSLRKRFHRFQESARSSGSDGAQGISATDWRFHDFGPLYTQNFPSEADP